MGEREREKGKEKEGEGSVRLRLPRRLLEMRAKTISVFISNIAPTMSKAEVSVMVWRAGRLVDVFIPLDPKKGVNRGFAFARFPTKKEAWKSIELISGRSWGSRKLHAQIAKFPKMMKGEASRSEKADGQMGSTSTGCGVGVRRNQGLKKEVGNLINIERKKGVRFSDWVVEDKLSDLRHSCVGFLKKASSLIMVEDWLFGVWGKMAQGMKWLNETTIWFSLSSEQEVEEVIGCWEKDSSSLFLGMERWMEVLPEPQRPRWFRLTRVPLHGWCEETFKLLERCLGERVMVEPMTASREKL